MFSNRLVPSAAVLCVALAAGATACGSNGAAKAASPGSAAASATAAAPASPSAAASPAGLDVSSLSADAILEKAHTAMSSITSMRMAGNVTTEGQKMVMDLRADKDKNCAGTVTVGSTGSVEIIHNGTGTWMKPDDAFWQNITAQEGHAAAGPAVAKMFSGKYLTGGQDDPNFKEMAGMCDMVAGIAGDNSKPDSVTKGATTTINGQGAIELDTKDSDGPGSVFIATQGAPYLLRMTSTGSEPGQFDLSEFNKPLDIQAPPAAQVINYNDFIKKAQSV